LKEQQEYELVQKLEINCEEVQTPLNRIVHSLEPWITWVILPLFALANAGVAFKGALGSIFSEPVALGVLAGLLLGKPIGVFLFVWLSVRWKLTELPQHTRMKHIYGVGWFCGIGFTMSLFVTDIAFVDEHLINLAKIGILLGSSLAVIGGYFILKRMFGEKEGKKLHG